MNDNAIKTLPQVRAFLDGTRAVEFSLNIRSERYDFVRRTLIQLAYHTVSKSDKGAVLSFLVHVGSYSRIQVKRLAKAWLQSTDDCDPVPARATAFPASTPTQTGACWPRHNGPPWG